VLDAACGAGTTLRFLNGEGFAAVGVDLSSNILKIKPGSPVIQANCGQVPLPSASQDAVLMECALSLSNEVEGALSEFGRLLRPGGWLVVTDIYIRELHDPRARNCLSDTSCLSGVQTEAHIRGQMENAGFTIRAWQDQTPAFKQWLARMVFKLGSLDAFYRHLSSCEGSAQKLSNTLGSQIKLGYYWMAAQKAE